MTTKHEDYFYAPLPPNPPTPQNYVVLPLYPFHTGNKRSLLCCLALAAALLLLSAAALLYPSDPTLTLSRLRLNKIQVLTSPRLSLSVSLSLTLRVFNRDFFSLRYSSLVVSVGYRGRELGFVTSDGGEIKARGSSYVNATLVLDGLEVVHDVVYLVEDLARGLIPFDTDSVVKGTVGIFFVDFRSSYGCTDLLGSCGVSLRVRDDGAMLNFKCNPLMKAIWEGRFYQLD
ncbi:hypothetical protein C3L33_03649, partial [Rhododendron williamsianum]